MDHSTKSPYNLDNLASDFNTHLGDLPKLSKPSKRSYRSDVSHFINWLKSHLRSTTIDSNLGITRENFDDYLTYLKSSQSPTLSTNRKLSALRLFFDYCVSHRIVSENYARQVGNLQKQNDDLLNIFTNDMKVEEDAQKDIQEFLRLTGIAT